MTIKKEKKTDKYVNPNNVNCAYFILLKEFETFKKIAQEGNEIKDAESSRKLYSDKVTDVLSKYFNPVIPYWVNTFVTFIETKELKIQPNDAYLRINPQTKEIWLRINEQTTQQDLLALWDDVEKAKEILRTDWVYPKISERDLEIYLRKEFGDEKYDQIVRDEDFIAKYDYLDNVQLTRIKYETNEKLKKYPK